MDNPSLRSGGFVVYSIDLAIMNSLFCVILRILMVF